MNFTTSYKLNNILHSSKAAIDLASIMVGIIVIGLIGGVIAATVFAVIPWAQDNAVKQQLSSIKVANEAFTTKNITDPAELSYLPPTVEVLHDSGFLGDLKSADSTSGKHYVYFACGVTGKHVDYIYASYIQKDTFSQVAFISSKGGTAQTVKNVTTSDDLNLLYAQACAGTVTNGLISK